MAKRKHSYFLYIIESPSDKDLYCQRTEGSLLLEALRLANVLDPIEAHVQYRLVVSANSFAGAFLDLPTKLSEHNGISPILHLSMHGDKSGLQLTDGTEITWDNLAIVLSEVNRNSAHNELIVCMSACNGFYGGLMQLNDLRRRPFDILVGPWNKPRWNDAAVAYVTFYHLLMNKGRSVETSVDAMNRASGNNNKFEFTSYRDILKFAKQHRKS
jgi:hypothetical protein